MCDPEVTENADQREVPLLAKRARLAVRPVIFERALAVPNGRHRDICLSKHQEEIVICLRRTVEAKARMELAAVGR